MIHNAPRRYVLRRDGEVLVAGVVSDGSVVVEELHPCLARAPGGVRHYPVVCPGVAGNGRDRGPTAPPVGRVGQLDLVHRLRRPIGSPRDRDGGPDKEVTCGRNFTD